MECSQTDSRFRSDSGYVFHLYQVTIICLLISTPLSCFMFLLYRNQVVFAQTSGDVLIWELDTQQERVLPGQGRGRVHSLAVSGSLMVLGLSDGRVECLETDGAGVCQMRAGPPHTQLTPGHVSHIRHVTRDTRDHVSVLTSGGLLCSWVIHHDQPQLVYSIR